ncbi:hypothetical protein DFH28DRAFT_879268 [Melampsora americana]|nr:hypothetical protein DFH28DRAFT_879268 [Melampsora americana]
MNGRDFNKKFYDRLSTAYHINKCTGDEEEDFDDGAAFANRPLHEEDMVDSIDLTCPSEGSDAEDKAANVANMYFTQGDFGDLYDGESDDDDFTPGDDEDVEDEDEEDDDDQFDTIGDAVMRE